MNQRIFKVAPLFWVAMALLAGTVVFLPGISGPWVFDDFANIVNNEYLKLTNLNANALYQAATSIGTGLSHRPIAMASFALNYYFAGSFENTAPYKLTNLAIHFVNATLVFAIARVLVSRYLLIEQKNRGLPGDVYYFCGVLALWWLVHPIALTSVLYVVQRMASLSAMFVLLGILGYLHGRELTLCGPSRKGWIQAIGSILVFGTLGLLSKENAALLPLFVLVIEMTLYPKAQPWVSWHNLPSKWRRIILIILTIAAVVAIILVIQWALAGYRYRHRDFTLMQRALTETRVLFIYLSLIYLPLLPRFGLQHDDIVVSTSLLNPWTTLPAVVGILSLIVLGIVLRRRTPLVSLGIFWFFVAHAMESTILPLEIAHEHRNYLASFGALLALMAAFVNLQRHLRRELLTTIFIALMITSAGITIVRASQWSSKTGLYEAEVRHHPASSRAIAGYASALADTGRFAESLNAFRQAYSLSPQEPGYLVNIHFLCGGLGCKPNADEQRKLLEHLSHGPITTLTVITLDYVTSCVRSNCAYMQLPLETWTRTILSRNDIHRRYRSLYLYMLGRSLFGQGRYKEAIKVLLESHRVDRDYLHPLFEAVNIQIELGNPAGARAALERLREANRHSRYPRDRDIARTATFVEKLESGSRAPHMENRRTQVPRNT